MFRALLYIFLIYLAYQFIFNFLIPVYKTTQHVRKGFREMSERMENSNGGTANHDKNQNSSSRQTQSEGNHVSEKVGEYIDFEDVK